MVPATEEAALQHDRAGGQQETLDLLHALSGAQQHQQQHAPPASVTANGSAAPAAAAGAELPGSSGDGPTSKNKRSFIGMFTRKQGTGTEGGEETRGSKGDAEAPAAGADDKKRSGGGGGKGKPAWLGRLASHQNSLDAPLAVSAAPSPFTQSNGGGSMRGSSGAAAVMLPGLPVAPVAPPSAAPSHSGSDAGTATATTSRSNSSRHSSPEGPGLQSYPVGYTDVSDVSAPSTANPSPAVALLGVNGIHAAAAAAGPSPALLPGSEEAGKQQAAAMVGGKQPGHRRNRSLTGLLKSGWLRRNTQSAGSESELAAESSTPHGSQPSTSRLGTPKTPSLKADSLGFSARSQGSTPATMYCFGLPGVKSGADGEVVAAVGGSAAAEDMELVEDAVLPLGAIGIRNIGNSCFVNAALQCLRYTPGLPLVLLPDLPERAQQAAAAVAARAAPGGSAASSSGVEAAGSSSAPAEGQGVDVHMQALARASSDVVNADAERARLALARAESLGAEAPAAAAGGAAGPEGAQGEAPAAATADATLPQGEAAATADAPATGAAPSEGEAAVAEVTAEAGAQDDVAAAAVVSGDGEGAEAAAEGQPQQQQQPPEAPAAPLPPRPASKPQRPARGALLAAFVQLVHQLYLKDDPGPVDPLPLLRLLRAFPTAADYFDGGQHDCQEVLRVVLDLLHDDLNRAPPRPGSTQSEGSEAATSSDPAAVTPATEQAVGELQGSVDAAAAGIAAEQDVAGGTAPPSPGQQQEAAEEADGAAAAPAPEQTLLQQLQQQLRLQQGEGAAAAGGVEDEAGKAERSWRQYISRDDSPITQLFGGQLQSSVTCHKCGARSTMYEPFWDLSLPLVREGKGSNFSWLGIKGTPTSLTDCLSAFTADERLEGDEAFQCEGCGGRTQATKHLRLQRLPRALVLHIKRFKYKGASTDKLTANVSFPLKELRLHQFVSPESGYGPADCVYDLYAVSNHYGNLTGGHYTAMCRAQLPGGEEAWYSFNDDQVFKVQPGQVVSQYAYMLFYVRRQYRRRGTGTPGSEGPPAAPSVRGAAAPQPAAAGVQ